MVIGPTPVATASMCKLLAAKGMGAPRRARDGVDGEGSGRKLVEVGEGDGSGAGPPVNSGITLRAAGERGSAMFTAHDSRLGTRGQLVGGTVEVQVVEILG